MPEKLGDCVTNLVSLTPGWSANRKGALSSALFRRVQVPLALE
jgi:hypothetical protein